MGRLKKTTIAELKRLGLDTDWPDESIAQFHIKIARQEEESERTKTRWASEEREAAARFPKEIKVGARFVEVASGRETVITKIDFDKYEVHLTYLDKNGNKIPGQVFEDSMSLFLEGIEDGCDIVEGYTPPTIVDGQIPVSRYTGNRDENLQTSYSKWKEIYMKL